MANIVIPQAAQELESKARMEYPDFWAACEAKLQEGETLAMRPDLIQDLGRQVQEAELAKFEAVQQEGQVTTETNEQVKQTSTSTGSSAEVVDVQVITEKKDEK